MKNNDSLMLMLATWGLYSLAPAPALAGVELTGVYIQQNYWQSDGSTVVPIAAANDPSLAALLATLGANGPGGNAKIQFTFNSSGPNDFTSVTLSGPGFITPQPLSAPVPAQNGNTINYQSVYTASNFSNLASLNATYSPGTYTFTATASDPTLSQTATLNYDTNHLPTANGTNAIPALTASSYNGLQGMNTGTPYTFNFNSFTGDGVPNPQQNPYTQVGIFSLASNQVVYGSPLLPNSATSYTIGANTLLPGTQYISILNFDNHVNLGCGNILTCNNLEFSNYSFGAFTTAQGTAADPATVNLAGGTLAAPTALPTNFGYVGQITGQIGGAPDVSFYKFYWGGGTFVATADVPNAPSNAQYDFELTNYLGTPLYDDPLIQNASGTLSEFLAPGFYEIGLIAENLTSDPSYTLTFDTPVEGGAAAPEPAAIALLCLGLAGLALVRHKAG